MRHKEAIEHAIHFIEMNIAEEFSIEDLAKQSMMSKWYFQRAFRKYTNLTVSDYVKRRRLTNAAQQLIHSERRILDIAMDSSFASQEAFTRSFQRMFGLTPGTYRRQFKDFIKQEVIDMKTPKGWMLTGSHPHEYKIGLDVKEVHFGKASGYIEALESVTNDGFATMMQTIKGERYKGKRVQFSGFVKSKDVTGWAGLWMRADNTNGETAVFDNMFNRKIQGSKEWAQYAVVLDIPKDCETISFGILLSGQGKSWIDDIQFVEVDETIPVTNLQNEEEDLPEEPQNLNFEEI